MRPRTDPRLLGHERPRTIVAALADGPRRAAELDRLPGVPRVALYEYLGDLGARGVVARRVRTEFPYRVNYELTGSGRILVANELLIERLRRSRIDHTGPDAQTSLSMLLRVLAPACPMPTDRHGGSCLLVEREPQREGASVVLLVDEGAVVVDRSRCPDTLHAYAGGPPQAWDQALLTGRSDGLSLGSDRELIRALVAALAAALNG